MKQEELNEVLRLHKLWLENNSDGVRADLRSADLMDANLRSADLRRADLRSADLSDADLDFSVFPLWCGSFNIKVNERLPIQLIYHICKMKIETDDADLKRLVNSKTFRKVANKFHRVSECGTV